MSAIQIPEKFTIWVCYVTLALTALALAPPVFQSKDTNRIWWSC